MGWALGICAGLALFAVWRDRFPKLRMWLFLFIGTMSVGLLGTADAKIATWLTATSNSLTHKVFGAAFGVVLIAVLIACEFWDRASPRGGSGGHRWAHSVMALIAPEIFIAAGGVFAVVMGWGTSLLTTIPQTINGLFLL